MSSRAIQRLRQEREVNAANKADELDEIEEEEEPPHQQGGAFLAMMDDSSSESESEEEEDDVVEKAEELPNDDDPAAVKDAANETIKKASPMGKLKQDPDLAQEEENLDDILAEFESKDEAIAAEQDSKPSAPWFHAIVSTLDERDLDIDHVMRTTLLGGSEAGPAASRRSRQSFLFGPPRDGWVKPPHFVGGGIGMTSYEDSTNNISLPWPYSCDVQEDDNLAQASQQWKDPKHWFTFLHSDTYTNDLLDYERIQNSGDVNALALFVAHHPFVVEALLQLAMVLYRTNQSQEGLSLLQRSLWILECSSLPSFRPLEGASCFMDYGRSENAPYFQALFRMIQISGIQGCIRTSLAVSRYVLALDPLNDPMGVLLLMDYFALLSHNNKSEQFVVSLVESNKISLNYKDESSGKEYRDDLMELPNWSYSYALALHRLSQQSDDEMSQKSNEALQSAIRKFPGVVEQLLIKNEVNTTGRSMRTDWPTALHDLRTYANNPVDSEDYDPITQHAASQACDLIIKIFVQRSHSLWSGDDVLFWLYKNCVSLLRESEESVERPQLSPTLIRYARCDPSDYEDRFQTLPQDANPLDPGLLAPALAVDPNRRRFLRRADMPGGAAHGADGAPPAIFPGGGNGLVIGGPPTNHIDPDDPLVEVLWRSMLPWNTVDGVPPPRR